VPTYEYKCSNCGEIFEFFQKMTDDPVRECPVCGAGLQRIISGGIGVIFKGSGFYTTDYKNSSSNFSGKTEEKKPDTSVDSSTKNTSSGKDEKPEKKIQTQP